MRLMIAALIAVGLAACGDIEPMSNAELAEWIDADQMDPKDLALGPYVVTFEDGSSHFWLHQDPGQMSILVDGSYVRVPIGELFDNPVHGRVEPMAHDMVWGAIDYGEGPKGFEACQRD